MTLVQRFGRLDLFITMTCNPNWKEIKRELLPGQTPQDRPNLLTRVFHAKLEELKKDINGKGVLGNIVAYAYVIEFQKRGLPHVYMLVVLDENDKLNNPDDYDQIVKAEIPNKHEESHLHNVVLKHMIHGSYCGIQNPKSPYMKNGRCKRNYPKSFAASTIQGNKSYPIYQRGATSFLNLMTIGGILQPTFKEAAEQQGLLEGDDSIRQCLLEAFTIRMPSALRRLFVTILVYCEPVGVRTLWDEFYPFMIEDYAFSSNLRCNVIVNRLLRDLNTFLVQFNKNIKDFDLPQMTTKVVSAMPRYIEDELSI
ncbi:PREDICTED: LOC110435698 isoform, partial [Prunus dulcis]